MNKKGQGWALPSILGVVSLALILLPLFGIMSKWFIPIGIVFLYIAIRLYSR